MKDSFSESKVSRESDMVPGWPFFSLEIQYQFPLWGQQKGRILVL